MGCALIDSEADEFADLDENQGRAGDGHETAAGPSHFQAEDHPGRDNARPQQAGSNLALLVRTYGYGQGRYVVDQYAK